MRGLCYVLGCVGLMACAPAIPDTGTRADGFVDYAQPRGGDPLAAAPGESERPRGDAPATIAETSGEMAISNEQDFEAVAARETIESDRARLERLREQYEVVQPGSLPRRRGNEGPNIVAYALGTTNAVGEQVYRRVNPLRNSASLRACAEFPSPDLAQIAFLERGGPERDPRSLDPDGDGFACDWDPGPYRGVARARR